MEGNGALNFSGTQTLGGSGDVRFVGSDIRTGLFATTVGTVLTIGAGMSIHGVSGRVGRPDGGNVALLGTIAALGGGTISVFKSTNYAAGTLTGGVWKAEANSILRIVGATIATNAATLVLDGASSHVYSAENDTINALASLSSNAAAGSLTLKNGAALATAALSNAGRISIEGNSTVAPAGYTQTAGTTTLANGGSLGAAAPAPPIAFQLLGGTLAGGGVINANLTNAATVAPGASLGSLIVHGGYTQTAAGALQVEIGGVTPGSGYDQLNVSGMASLDGALNVSLVNGFGPTLGQRFDVVA